MTQDLFQQHMQTTIDASSTGHKPNYVDRPPQDTRASLRKHGTVWTNQHVDSSYDIPPTETPQTTPSLRPPNNNNRTDAPRTNEQEKPTTGGSTQDKANPIRRPQTMKTQHHQMNQSDAPTAYNHRGLSIKKTNHMAQSISTSDEDSSWKLKEKLTKPREQDYVTSNYA